ncbi:MAG: fimbrillin family protein [Bacteroidales bacterium]|nr:fimbrillin family protein [Bacteroidales bacterium]
MKSYLQHITLASIMALSVIGCTVEPIDQPTGEKSPVELRVGLASDDLMTKSTNTDGADKTLRAFTGDTRLFFMMVAEKESSPALYGYNYGKAAAVSTPASGSSSEVSFDANYLYWDDAYARDTRVSVYSVAAANAEIASATIGSKTVGTSNKVIGFSADTNSPVVDWTVGNGSAQTEATFAKDDLVFSNNVRKIDESHDNRLKFHTEEGDMHHKFDKGELNYYHALSRITVFIKCGDGFVGNGSDFQFASNPTGADNSFALNGFNGSGTFDVKEGEFTAVSAQNFSSIYLQNTSAQKTNPYYTLGAYVVPGTDIKTGTVSDAFSFNIDNNRYDISMSDLYNAIKGNPVNVVSDEVNSSILDDGKLKAGVHYQFTFIVSKTKIGGIVAKVVDWEDVVAEEQTPSNARISLVLEDRGSAVTSNVALYRAEDTGSNSVVDTYQGYIWGTGYSNEGSNFSYDPGTSKWTSSWYWPGNTTYYHFRAVSPSSTAVETDSENGDYFEITAGESLSDYTWGAPFKDVDPSAKFKYSLTLGFDGTDAHQIHYGIGPTNDIIRVMMMHMMSKVTFVLKTTADDSAVSFGDGTGSNCTTITLKNINKAGKVLMGTGLVSTTDSRSDYLFTATPAPVSGQVTWAEYGAVPQSLDGVVLVIKTADNNLYEVTMKDVLSSSVSSNNLVNPYEEVSTGKFRIHRWYPNYNYTYTFKLSKTGIKSIDATILEWEDVVAGDDNVQIK